MTYTLSQVTESIGTITLDHERRRNALSHALVEEVIAALRSFQEAKVRVVILRAKPGAKVFSAGHDIDELPESRRDPHRLGDPEPVSPTDLTNNRAVIQVAIPMLDHVPK
jgi:methylmalonyl-CoA decarboxylase